MAHWLGLRCDTHLVYPLNQDGGLSVGACSASSARANATDPKTNLYHSSYTLCFYSSTTRIVLWKLYLYMTYFPCVRGLAVGARTCGEYDWNLVIQIFFV